MTTIKERILSSIDGGLIVSCQTQPPLAGAEVIALMAKAVVEAGAVGIRANGKDNVAAIRKLVDVPIIGINKQKIPGYQVYITPTLESAQEIIDAGADIIALDGSPSPRPTGIALKDMIAAIHRANVLVMADISTLDEGLYAVEAGADIVSTTLSGYTPYSPQQKEPDLKLVEDLARTITTPILAEGRYATAEHVRQAFERGVLAVVVGRAITEPQLLTREIIKGTPRGAVSSHE